ncbi:secretagogin-like isoform X2 [Embiotoca jacksoni]|uniref:secretagogin-like isoform X2 n=1 Tax=Embiotoca jacksoni TaxID=100190 RepID=UPI003703DEA3
MDSSMDSTVDSSVDSTVDSSMDSTVDSSVDSTVDSSMDNLDAAGFLQIWQRFDKDDVGFIEGAQLDDFFQHVMLNLGMKLAAAMLPDEENFLLLFRRETPLDNSVEFMRIWRNYDTDSSGYISAVELKGFLQDLFLQHGKSVTPGKLEEYTVTMMKMFDKNRDGRLDLNDLARILSLKENFLLKFKLDACSQDDRKRDFEKIFAHYDVSQTGALEGPEVDGFVKDMMELVKPSISGTDLDRFKKALMGHCDINGDGKIQKNELALCLGLKLC